MFAALPPRSSPIYNIQTAVTKLALLSGLREFTCFYVRSFEKCTFMCFWYMYVKSVSESHALQATWHVAIHSTRLRQFWLEPAFFWTLAMASNAEEILLELMNAFKWQRGSSCLPIDLDMLPAWQTLYFIIQCVFVFRLCFCCYCKK